MDEVSAVRIRQLVSQKPGLKAQQIASELGLDRSHVAAALHGLSELVQDNAYRWWPRKPAAPPENTGSPAAPSSR